LGGSTGLHFVHTLEGAASLPLVVATVDADIALELLAARVKPPCTMWLLRWFLFASDAIGLGAVIKTTMTAKGRGGTN
jgi:hypothetical protein